MAFCFNDYISCSNPLIISAPNGIGKLSSPGAVVLQFQSIDSFLSSYFKLKDRIINGRQINLKLIPNIVEVHVSFYFQYFLSIYL